MKYDISTREGRIKFVCENKKTLIAQKKGAVKHADACGVTLTMTNKSAPIAGDVPDILKVRAVINTTNIMDSHDDVHLAGLWTKTLKENRAIMHLQEHEMAFEKIIADGDDVRAFVKDYEWRDLGYDFDGVTQALLFDSNVDKGRNHYMHDLYAKGRVRNHSVGMNYVKISLAVDDPEMEAEHEVWKRHIDDIVNADLAEEKGYFWAVYEAKLIEGSAVPMGSNWVTPTIEVKSEPPVTGTHDEYLSTVKSILKWN